MTKHIRNNKKTKCTSIISKFFKKVFKKHEEEYSKRLLSRIINNSILMMWGTYILAWFGKTDIAETLSKTIAASIIAVVVGYLAKSVIENISKHTDTFGKNIDSIQPDIRFDNTDDAQFVNGNRDC